MAENSIRVIDSHTGGEPTRVVVSGGPDLGDSGMAKRLRSLRDNYDWFRSAVVNEPRGSDVLVGALLCEPADAGSVAGVLFFNNVGYLAMCGHGSIGLAVTLAHLGRISPGQHILETPPGNVSLVLHDQHRVSVSNVESYRYRKDVSVKVAGIGSVTGDVAWGGNWFFLVSEHGQTLTLDNVDALTDYTWAIRKALEEQGITGRDKQLIDHVELFARADDPTRADSKNFVLCPGKAYDRSPCGTGTSAKLACLVGDGKLEPGDTWRQEGITGSIFEAQATEAGNGILPVITGEAFITSESTLIVDPDDPFRFGLSAPGA